jgi:DNA-binding NtrC family response regulator
MEALRAAKNGSLCIWSKPLPADFTEMTAALRDPDTRVQLIVCGTDPREAEAFGVVPVVIPPLADRKEDLPRIVEEYAHEITAGLGFERASFPRSDQRWVIEHSAGSLPEIEQAILRILRLRQAAGDRAFAAEMLGMSKSYLNKWVKSRNPPIPKRGQGFNADT